MPPLRESVGLWYQTGKGWCLDIVYYGRGIVNTNRSHWPAGLMFGFSGAASILFGKSEIPWISYGAFLGFITSAAKYASVYLAEITRYGGHTSLTLLAITIFIFHGITSWATVFTWLPIFVSITLLTTVNIAPGVVEKFNAFGESLSALGERLRPVERPRVQALDVEQAQDLLAEMAELRGFDYRRQRRTSSTRSYRRCLSEPRDLGSPVGAEESIELDGDSVSTTPEVSREMERFESGPSSGPQYIAIANTGRIEEHRIWFPEIPQESFLETATSENTPSPRIEEPPLEMLTLA